MFKTLAFATTLILGASAVAHAAERVVVIELYTSQGCSSCPPADALLGELAERDDVIPLALHVDYWDYIGWKDEFADPKHTVRQKGYAAAAGQRTIYTPQMIVGGLDHVVGYRPMQLAKLIQSHAEKSKSVDLSLTRTGDDVAITAPGVSGLGQMVLHLVRYAPERTVNIRRGENAGKTLTYHNVVTLFEPIGEWDGAAPLEISVQAAGDEPVVVLVQQPPHGAIVAAARLR